MASRKFYTGHMVSDLAVNDMISNMQETADQVEFDRLSDEYRQHMIAALEALDDRLWWEPETGSVNYEDDGSDKPLPDDFESWWTEMTSTWIASK